jgi:hypothetical protein
MGGQVRLGQRVVANSTDSKRTSRRLKHSFLLLQHANWQYTQDTRTWHDVSQVLGQWTMVSQFFFFYLVRLMALMLALPALSSLTFLFTT